MEKNKYTPCGGCGAESPLERCIGCFHPFEPIATKLSIEWINLADNYTEDWQIMHCRYASDGRKLDTELFEEKNGGLVKVGGTGRLELNEVEYLIESGSNELVQENERLKAKLSTYHGIKERCDKMEAALKQFISYHETGLLPDIFTYKKAVETLKQGGSNTPASVQGEKEVDNEQ